MDGSSGTPDTNMDNKVWHRDLFPLPRENSEANVSTSTSGRMANIGTNSSDQQDSRHGLMAHVLKYFGQVDSGQNAGTIRIDLNRDSQKVKLLAEFASKWCRNEQDDNETFTSNGQLKGNDQVPTTSAGEEELETSILQSVGIEKVVFYNTPAPTESDSEIKTEEGESRHLTKQHPDPVIDNKVNIDFSESAVDKVPYEIIPTECRLIDEIKKEYDSSDGDFEEDIQDDGSRETASEPTILDYGKAQVKDEPEIGDNEGQLPLVASTIKDEPCVEDSTDVEEEVAASNSDSDATIVMSDYLPEESPDLEQCSKEKRKEKDNGPMSCSKEKREEKDNGPMSCSKEKREEKDDNGPMSCSKEKREEKDDNGPISEKGTSPSQPIKVYVAINETVSKDPSLNTVPCKARCRHCLEMKDIRIHHNKTIEAYVSYTCAGCLSSKMDTSAEKEETADNEVNKQTDFVPPQEHEDLLRFHNSFMCYKCGFTALGSLQLYTHIFDDHNISKCQFCMKGKCHPTVSYLHQHVLRHAERFANRKGHKPESTERWTRHCLLCGEKFINTIARLNHELKVHDLRKRRFQCHHCSMCFESFRTLQKHTEDHKDKPCLEDGTNFEEVDTASNSDSDATIIMSDYLPEGSLDLEQGSKKKRKKKDNGHLSKKGKSSSDPIEVNADSSETVSKDPSLTTVPCKAWCRQCLKTKDINIHHNEIIEAYVYYSCDDCMSSKGGTFIEKKETCSNEMSQQTDFVPPREHEDLLRFHNSFMCHKCGFTALDSLHLYTHIFDDHNIAKCQFCMKGKGHPTVSDLHQHVLRHAERFAVQETSHKPESTERRIRHCLMCGEKFFTASIRLRHELKVHDLRKRRFRCHHCSMRFEGFRALRTHIEDHKKGVKIVCDTCNMVFSTLRTLEVHVARMHLKAPSRFLCEICGYGCKDSHVLGMHMSSHRNDKPFECAHCHSRFNRKSSLKTHMRKHLKIMPYKCEYCGKGSTRADNLKNHIKNKHTIKRKRKKRTRKYLS